MDNPVKQVENGVKWSRKGKKINESYKKELDFTHNNWRDNRLAGLLLPFYYD